jgi:mannose-6-phosphate isomerase
MTAQRLDGEFHEKVWGVVWPEGPHAGRKIGEIWFHAEPLLVKFIFTSQKLSVQVHPGDAYAAQHERERGGRGKTEMWCVMETEPGAKLAVGCARAMSREELRGAARDGSLEGALRWYEPRPGDAFFVPAGTVHALGAGLTLCEIQQRSDITYRLFDYGRDRELHVEKALDVARDLPEAGPAPLPFACASFRVARVSAGAAGPGHLVVLRGAGSLDGRPCHAREVWRLDAPVVLKMESEQPCECLLVKP